MEIAEMAAFYGESKEAFDKAIGIGRDANKIWTPSYPDFSMAELHEQIGR
jgi:hypothetical protein